MTLEETSYRGPDNLGGGQSSNLYGPSSVGGFIDHRSVTDRMFSGRGIGVLSYLSVYIEYDVSRGVLVSLRSFSRFGHGTNRRRGKDRTKEVRERSNWIHVKELFSEGGL